MKTIYFRIQDVPLLEQLGIQGEIPVIPWATAVPDGVMYSVEHVLSDPEVAQLAAKMPTIVKGIKPGTRGGSPT